MDKVINKGVALGTGVLLVTAGAAGGLASLNEAYGDSGDVVLAETAIESAEESSVVRLSEVAGQFLYTQTEVASNADLKEKIATASQYLCGAHGLDAIDQDVIDSWEITFGGKVAQGFTATTVELSEDEGLQTVILGCSCQGNPIDGLASANAEVTGLPMAEIISRVQPAEDVNAVVFTSADGYEVALPLSYFGKRYCPLVLNVNGEALEQSIGGVNQLWLGSTAASYFARDIVAVSFEAWDEEPASPSSEEARAAYANLPNIGVVFGGDVR